MICIDRCFWWQVIGILLHFRFSILPGIFGILHNRTTRSWKIHKEERGMWWIEWQYTWRWSGEASVSSMINRKYKKKNSSTEHLRTIVNKKMTKTFGGKSLPIFQVAQSETKPNCSILAKCSRKINFRLTLSRFSELLSRRN